MSAQRLTRELRRVSAGTKRLQMAFALIGLALPLSGCGTGALWDKFFAKDEANFADEPADKLYNEGLYLMNQKKDNKAATNMPVPDADNQPPQHFLFAFEIREQRRHLLLVHAFDECRHHLPDCLTRKVSRSRRRSRPRSCWLTCQT